MWSPLDMAAATFAGVTCMSKSMGSKSVFASQLQQREMGRASETS